MAENIKNILFLTGTRADFGKLKALIRRAEESEQFDCSLFVTGMHTLSRYGYTVDEVYKSLEEHRLAQGFRSVYTFMNQAPGEPMERILARTIDGLSYYVHEFKPDMIVVHGDRVEALAGAIVGALRNIIVAHIEGGEISGAIDGAIRHAVTKMAHVHFVANAEAASRLKQLGEREDSIFVIGSPDIDIMLSPDLPDIDEVKSYYEIPFDDYGVAILHPVTTDPEGTRRAADALVLALKEGDTNCVVIYPNNDEGCELVFAAYEQLADDERFVMLPSMRMEYFLTLLKNAGFIVGNSSAGIREAPVYGVHSINIDGRQDNRFSHETIWDVKGTKDDILGAIAKAKGLQQRDPCYYFGDGNSADLFMAALADEQLWRIPKQKQFVDIPLGSVFSESRVEKDVTQE